MGRRRRTPPADPLETAAAIQADPRVTWFPVKHYSPACAHHVRRLVEELRPDAVLVEGPEDATDAIAHVVDPETVPPITILSSYVDERNRFGQNGVLSGPEQPARYRGWWPLVSSSPEYAALRAGSRIGAALRFVDAPMVATIPFTHIRPHRRSTAVDDALLAENAWFDALGRKRRRRSFEEFWEGDFETRGLHQPTDAFVRDLLVFAWCARNLSPPEAREADGTLLREAHMRWHVDRALEEFDGRVVVVTGAYHTVALPWTKGRRAPDKPDRYTTTLLGAHSYKALARLYAMNRHPAWGHAVQEALEAGEERPFDAAADRLLVGIVREGRERGLGLGTADAAAAARQARQLAALRGNAEVTRHDLLDAAQSTFVKGELGVAGEPVLDVVREVLVGRCVGRVTPAAGQVPLIRDFYAQARANRLDLDGAARTVRCDLLRQQAHRRKSAFLHRCAWLEIPMFEAIDHGSGDRPWFRGPDLATGEDLHLLGETWGVRWTEEVDDRLLELSDRGATIEEVASVTWAEQLPPARADVARAGRLMLEAARMLLEEPFDRALATVAEAVAVDAAFPHLVEALADAVLLHGYRDALPTAGDPRVAALAAVAHERACLALPQLRLTPPEEADGALDRLQTLVRITLTFEGAPLDERLLVERIREMVADPDGEPSVRGAGFGVLYGFGAARALTIARALEAYAGATAERARGAGGFLDGLFLTGKGLMLRNPRLLRAVDRVITSLDWETFKLLLPDLRRAFTRFVPTEIDAIGQRLARELSMGRSQAVFGTPDENALRRLHEADARVAGRLREWERPTPG